MIKEDNISNVNPNNRDNDGFSFNYEEHHKKVFNNVHLELKGSCKKQKNGMRWTSVSY